jgi:hypothetical protein
MAGIIDDLALDDALVVVVDGVAGAAVMVMATVLPIVAPLALVGNFTGAILASGADAVGELD